MSALISDEVPTLLELYDSSAIADIASVQKDASALVAELIKQEMYDHAVIFLAYGFKIPVAVSWGYFCLVHAHIEWTDLELEALDNTLVWLKDPSTAHRRLHEHVLEQTGVSSPAGWLSQAVFWSGGSITPEGMPEASPQPFLFAHALSGSVRLAALSENGQHSEVLFPLYAKTGQRLVTGMPHEKLRTINIERAR